MKEERSLHPAPRNRPLAGFLSATLALGVLSITIIYSARLNYPPIRSDAVGYYLYLPAVFIHHDITLQSTADELFGGQIPAWTGAKPWQGTPNYLIKYPMGEAILIMPFFFLACVVAWVTNAPVDGFSWPFQYIVALSGLFYASAGIAILWKLLARHFSQSSILVAMVGIVFGTNLFHYSTYDSLFSHAFSFFLFSAFLYSVQFAYEEDSSKALVMAGALAGLIVVARPTNALVLLFAVLYGITSGRSPAARLLFWRDYAKSLMLALFMFGAVISLQLTYWKLITGSLIVYSYADESFYFNDPQILNVLFSVRKGLFFWSPVLLMVFPGLIFLRKRASAWFLPILLFLPLNVYVISSWHYWAYGGSFGHRTFVESMSIFAIPLCVLLEEASSYSFWRRGLLVMVVICVAYTSWLMVKYWTGVIPFDGTQWDYFLKTFFLLHKT